MPDVIHPDHPDLERWDCPESNLPYWVDVRGWELAPPLPPPEVEPDVELNAPESVLSVPSDTNTPSDGDTEGN